MSTAKLTAASSWSRKQPFVLSTIAYATVGVVLLLCRQHLPKTADSRADFKALSLDQGWFLAIFAAKITLGLIVFAFKPWLGVLFLGAYAAYFWKEMRGEDIGEATELEPLKLTPRRATPTAWAAGAQTLGALVVIFFASGRAGRRFDRGSAHPERGLFKPEIRAV